MQKNKHEKVKAEPNIIKNNSNQQHVSKKYVMESPWYHIQLLRSESSNLASNHEGSRTSNKPSLSKNYLKTRDFI